MFQEILAAISLGQRLLKGLAALRKDAASLRTPKPAQKEEVFVEWETLQQRTSDLEAIAQAQEKRIDEIESVLKENMVVVEALARRVGMIFWIAVTGCAVGVVALVVAAVALGRSLR